MKRTPVLLLIRLSFLTSLAFAEFRARHLTQREIEKEAKLLLDLLQPIYYDFDGDIVKSCGCCPIRRRVI